MMFIPNLPYDVYILMSIGPAIIFIFYLRSVMMARPVKVILESQDKDLNMDTLYRANWNIKTNSVTIHKSKKEKIEVKKAGAPKYIHIPPLSTWIVFRVKEKGSQTHPWDAEDIQEAKDAHQLGYEAKAMVSGLVDDLKSKAIRGIREGMMWIIGGAGGGFGLGVMAALLLL